MCRWGSVTKRQLADISVGQLVLSSSPAATMDKLESLSSTLANITLYDIKSMYNQACFVQVVLDVIADTAISRSEKKTLSGQKHGLERDGNGGQSERGDERRSMVNPMLL